jgi:hypothetical protein
MLPVFPPLRRRVLLTHWYLTAKTLRSRDRACALVSELQRSCSLILIILDGSQIHTCRRTAAIKFVAM